MIVLHSPYPCLSSIDVHCPAQETLRASRGVQDIRQPEAGGARGCLERELHRHASRYPCGSLCTSHPANQQKSLLERFSSPRPFFPCPLSLLDCSPSCQL